MHEVADLERSLWDSQRRNDRDHVDRLLHPDYLEIGSTGRTWMRHEILEPVGDFEAQVADLTVAELTADAVLVTYTSVVHDLTTDDEIIGRPVKRASLWLYRDNRWLLRYHQGTPDLGV